MAGLWLTVYWTPVLFGSAPEPALTGLAEPFSGALTTWLADNAVPATAAALGVIAVGVAAVIAVRRRAAVRRH